MPQNLLKNASLYVKYCCILADPIILYFPDLLLLKEGETLTVESNIYGKPKPVSNVKFLGRTFNAKSSSEIQNNIYRFVYDLGHLTDIECGMVLVLIVSGNGKEINQSATVIVQCK